MRFHVVGLPSSCTDAKSSCAFTALTANFMRMMKSLGHTVIHYGVGCNVECESVKIMDPVEMDWSGKAAYWSRYNDSVAKAITERKQRGDFVCVINGVLNQSLGQLSDVMVVEHSIGYNGTFAKYKVFASYAHMHKLLGVESHDPDGKWYDAVIPHYLDPNAYAQGVKGDYYLYVGRLIRRKGVQVAVETCKRLGVKLKLAGAGVRHVDGNRIYCSDGEVYEGEYVGFVNHEERVKLYQGAIATFTPTIYVEPFNMTVIEAQMCGTPVIATDWGSFPEIIEHGKTGFRCHTLNEFEHAARLAPTLDNDYIRKQTVQRYSIDNIKWKYETYFRRLQDLWGDGWYASHDLDKHWSEPWL